MAKVNRVSKLLPALQATVDVLVQEFDGISIGRRTILRQLTQFVEVKVNAGQTARLNFICTHNSRRSHMAQVWAQAAAFYYGLSGVECYSGGTEATAFNPRAVSAMQAAGYNIRVAKEGGNPVYEIRFSSESPTINAFSKTYDDSYNPKHDFAAIMTCSHADENCPLVVGASARIALTYDDPKDFDGTPMEGTKYKERVLQIGREILFAFSEIKPKQ